MWKKYKLIGVVMDWKRNGFNLSWKRAKWWKDWWIYPVWVSRVDWLWDTEAVSYNTKVKSNTNTCYHTINTNLPSNTEQTPESVSWPLWCCEKAMFAIYSWNRTPGHYHLLHKQYLAFISISMIHNYSST